MKTRKLIKETGMRTDIFHTGDVAYCGKESELWYIVDREKEATTVRAFQVVPAELKGVLLSHPDNIGAAGIGIKLASARSFLVHISSQGLARG